MCIVRLIAVEINLLNYFSMIFPFIGFLYFLNISFSLLYLQNSGENLYSSVSNNALES